MLAHRVNATLMRAAIIAITAAIVGLILWFRYLVVFRAFLPGYRGAVGVKNCGDTEIASAQIRGFDTVMSYFTIGPGEHTFAWVRRGLLPTEAEITWRTTSDATDRTTRVSLSMIPPEFKDGEIFFALSTTGEWSVQFAPELQWDKAIEDESFNHGSGPPDASHD